MRFLSILWRYIFVNTWTGTNPSPYGIVYKMNRNPEINNRKARYQYIFIETFEAGIELKGTEVKSLRNGKGSINEAFARVEKDQIYMHNMHIDPYTHGNMANVDPLRKRKLLLHKSEIQKITKALGEKGLAFVPTKLYFKRGFAKIKMAICKGKTNPDKRQDIKKREADREIRRVMKRS